MRITFDGEPFAKKELNLFMKAFSLLDESEQDRFLIFLNSPYFNPDIRLSRLYERMLSSFRNGSTRINGRPLLEFVFGDLAEKSAKRMLKKFLKQLPDLALDLIRHEEVRDKGSINGRASMISLKRRTDSSFFHEAAEKMEQEMKQMLPAIMPFQDSWWMYHQLYFHQYARQYHPEDTKRLYQATQYLHLFYQLTYLRYYCEILNREKILGEEKRFSILKKEAGIFIDEENELSIIKLYSLLARILQFPEQTEIYEKFKAYYRRHAGELAAPDQLAMVKSIFNVWIRHYEAGRENAPDELVYWAKIGVKAGVFLFESSISDKEYLNIAIAAGLAEAFDFMEQYISDYREHLEKQVRESAYQMARIYLHFFRKELVAGLKRLETHFPYQKSFDHIYTLRAKVIYILIYLMCCIEQEKIHVQGLKCHDHFYSHMDAYRQYLKRADLLDKDRRHPYKRFYDYCNRIYHFALETSDQQTKDRKEEILRDIKNEKTLLARHNLLAIASTLKAR